MPLPPPLPPPLSSHPKDAFKRQLKAVEPEWLGYGKQFAEFVLPRLDQNKLCVDCNAVYHGTPAPIPAV